MCVGARARVRTCVCLDTYLCPCARPCMGPCASICLFFKHSSLKETSGSRNWNPYSESSSYKISRHLTVPVSFGIYRNFHGRHCEYFMRRRPCGTVKHDTWQRRGCNLCRCVDGILACFSRLFDGCGQYNHLETYGCIRSQLKKKGYRKFFGTLFLRYDNVLLTFLESFLYVPVTLCGNFTVEPNYSLLLTLWKSYLFAG